LKKSDFTEIFKNNPVFVILVILGSLLFLGGFLSDLPSDNTNQNEGYARIISLAGVAILFIATFYLRRK
jgi:hypothetical protein